MSKALMIIDLQKAIDHPRWGKRSNPGAEANIASLLAAWRAAGWPVVHIRHDSVSPASPYRPGQPLHAFKDEVQPQAGESIIGKHTNNAFVGTGLDTLLQEKGISEIIITGVLTQHSVDTTARMAASLGYKVTVVADATAASEATGLTGQHWRADEVQAMTLAHLAADYASITTTSELLSSF